MIGARVLSGISIELCGAALLTTTSGRTGGYFGGFLVGAGLCIALSVFID